MKLKIATVFTLGLKTRNCNEVSEIKGQTFGELTVMSWDCLSIEKQPLLCKITF